MKKQTENDLENRILELEAENRRLKATIKSLEAGRKDFYTLKEQIASTIDLGELKKKLPPFIPEHKKWRANDYPKEWSPKERASDYLLSLWENYPVSQSFFSNVKGGQSFYKYLKRNDLFDLLPNSFQLEFKKRILKNK